MNETVRGEWTTTTIARLSAELPAGANWGKFIAEAHNAALRAQQERYDDLQRSIMDLSHPNCKDLLEKLEAQQQDTKRLAEFVRRCADHMICGSNLANTPLPTEQEWREILAISDAALRTQQDTSGEKRGKA